MNKTSITRWLSFILCVVLIAALALMAVGCSETEEAPEAPASEAVTATPIGEGATTFDLTVTKADGSKTAYAVSTDETTVGAALQELALIEGEEGDYGLYIKSVNGIIADYDTNGTYWAFYINGEYAMSGVDVTEIEEGAAYALRVEK